MNSSDLRKVILHIQMEREYPAFNPYLEAFLEFLDNGQVSVLTQDIVGARVANYGKYDTKTMFLPNYMLSDGEVMTAVSTILPMLYGLSGPRLLNYQDELEIALRGVACLVS